jgi:hypothetical protein
MNPTSVVNRVLEADLEKPALLDSKMLLRPVFYGFLKRGVEADAG